MIQAGIVFNPDDLRDGPHIRIGGHLLSLWQKVAVFQGGSKDVLSAELGVQGAEFGSRLVSDPGSHLAGCPNPDCLDVFGR